MFRLWVKEWKDSRLVRDTVVENDDRDTRTHKVLRGLEEGCRRFDLPVPIWLDSSIRDFQRHADPGHRRGHVLIRGMTVMVLEKEMTTGWKSVPMWTLFHIVFNN